MGRRNEILTIDDLLERHCKPPGPIPVSLPIALTEGCREAKNRPIKSKYTSIRCKGRRWRIHRLAYYLANGIHPGKLQVQHKCNNPPCCEPAHLKLGMPDENSKYMMECGRAATGERNGKYTKPEATARGERHGWQTKPESRCFGSRNGMHTKPEKRSCGERNGMNTKPSSRLKGEKNGSSKLTDVQVREIYTRCKSKQSYASIAREFRVSDVLVGKIARGEIWRHLLLEQTK